MKRLLVIGLCFTIAWIWFVTFMNGPTKLYSKKEYISYENELSETEYINQLISHIEDKYALVVQKDNHFVFDIEKMPAIFNFIDIFNFFDTWAAMRLDVYYEDGYVEYTYYIGECRVIYDTAVNDIDPSALTADAWIE